MAKQPARGRGNPALRLAALRQIHVYLGVFIAPSVIFFALSGALQLFSLHESHGDYHPPAIIEQMGSVHKDQILKPSATEGGSEAHDDDHHHPDDADAPKSGAAHLHAGPKRATVILKWFFLAVATGLIVTTLLGLWMALSYNRRKAVVWILFIAGVAAPLAILFL